MKIYHPSDTKFDTVKVEHFGEHNHTMNDVKASSIKRSFWYTELPISEKYIYVTEIDDDQIYDLRKDELKVLQKQPTIHQALVFLKELYTGVLYSRINNAGVIAIFKDMKPTEIREKRYAQNDITKN